MNEQALRDDEVSHAQFRALANSIPNLAWMAHPDGWIFWYNRRWYEYTGTTPEEMAGWGWQSVHHPDVLPDTMERWTAAISDGKSFEMTFPLRSKDSVFRPFLTRVEPLREQGEIVGWFGTNTEVTEQERTRERLQLMVNELNHRVKNTLATIQSVASNTFKASDPATLDTFNHRLRALSAVHDVLTRESWAHASVGDVVETALLHADISRFDIEGPEVQIEPRTASALAMTLHELCTNAAKYGALSDAKGRISFCWELAGDHRRALKMRWEESGGPPVTQPSRKGFGVGLIERVLATDKGASVNLDFEPTGLTCQICVPLGLDVLL